MVFESTDQNETISGNPVWFDPVNRSVSSLGGGNYRITVSWSYQANWIEDGITSDRSATISAGGQSATVTQPGIDNTYLYHPPLDSITMDHLGGKSVQIDVYANVAASRMSSEIVDSDIISHVSGIDGRIDHEPIPGQERYGERTYIDGFFVHLNPNWVEDGDTLERIGTVRVGAPESLGDTIEVTQAGIDNTYLYHPSLDSIALDHLGGQSVQIDVYANVAISRMASQIIDGDMISQVSGIDPRIDNVAIPGQEHFGERTYIDGFFVHVNPNWVEDGDTGERIGTVKVGAPDSLGDTITVTQSGIENTYLYHPPLDSITMDHLGGRSGQIEVYANVPASRMAYQVIDSDVVTAVTGMDPRIDNVASPGQHYYGQRTYIDGFFVHLAPNWIAGDSTTDRQGTVRVGVPGELGDTITVTQSGFDDGNRVEISPATVPSLGSSEVNVKVLSRLSGSSYMVPPVSPWITGGGSGSTSIPETIDGETFYYDTVVLTVAPQDDDRSVWHAPRQGKILVDDDPYFITQTGGGFDFVVTPVSDKDGHVTVSYEMGDQLDPNEVSVSYSVDGEEFEEISLDDFVQDAAQVGPGVTPGPHQFAWDASALKHRASDGKTIQVRVDGEAGYFAISDGFTLDGSCPCDEGICPPGKAESEVGSVFVRIRLGLNERGQDYGEWWIHEERANPALGTPAVLWQLGLHQALGYPNLPLDRRARGHLYDQYLTGSVLIAVSDSNPLDGRWQVAVYDAATQLGSEDPLTGTYNQGGKTPFQTIQFSLERGTDGAIERFRVTENGVFGNRVHLYHWEEQPDGSPGWTLDRIDPVHGLLRSEKMIESALVDEVMTEERQVLEADGTLAAKTVTTLRRFSFGERPVQIERFNIRDGAESGSQKTYFTYHEVEGQPGYGLVDETYNDYDSTWIQSIYGPDGLAEVHSTYLDAGRGSADSEHKVVYHEEVAGEFGLGPETDEARITSVALAGTVVARNVTVWYGDELNGGTSGGEHFTYRERWEIALVDPSIDTVAGALGAGDGVLITRTRTYTSGENSGEIHGVRHPDGTGTITEFTGDDTTIIRTGQLSADGFSLVDGIRQVQVVNAFGYPTATQTFAVPEEKLIAQDLVMESDGLGRPTRIQHIGGLESRATYSCCGLDSKTDVRGISTLYQRDILGRLRREESLGIVTEYEVDALGRVIEGRDSAGGKVIVRRRVSTDSLGLDISTTDALNRSTRRVRSYDDGRRVITGTNAEGGVMVEATYRDGRVKTITGAPTYPRRFEYGVGQTEGGIGPQSFVTSHVLDRNGTDTGEWTRSWRDAVGRIWKRESSSGATVIDGFNGKGQLVSRRDADGVTTLYAYNGRGQRSHSAVDINRNGVIDFDGPDRITEVTYVVAERGGETVHRIETTLWRDAGEELFTTEDRTVDGLQGWSTLGGVTRHEATALQGNGDWTVTRTAADGSRGVQQFSAGRLASETLQAADGTRLGQTSYSWDDHGRLEASTDARNGTTTMTWLDSDELQSVTTPAPGVGGGLAQTTSFTYDAMGRIDLTNLPDGTTVDSDYFPTGEIRRQSGSRTYTREFDYDAAGRLITLTTNPGTAESQVTEWTFDPVTGRLQNKQIAGALTVSYTYTTAGRLETRTGARNIVTDYDYNAAGELARVSYSDGSTDSIDYTYDRTGDLRTVVHGDATWQFFHGLPGQRELTTVSGGILDGAIIDPAYDTLHRRERLEVHPGGGGAVVNQTWTYEPGTSRLRSVGKGDYEAVFAYETDSGLVKGIDYRLGGDSRLTETRVHDQLNRLRSVTHLGEATIDALSKSFTYTYNEANQRTRVEREGGNRWQFGYDSLGHVTSGAHQLDDGTPLAGQQFGYQYDSLGNRTEVSFGGDSTGTGGLENITYTANEGTGQDRNQYAGIDCPGVVLVTGQANAGATIRVNGEVAEDRQGENFSHQVTVDNQSGARTVDVTITAEQDGQVDSITRQELVPAKDCSWTYDPDGNLTFDGYRDFTWDAENRLLSVQTRADCVPEGAPEYRIEYDYDFLGRRIRHRAERKIGNEWYPIADRRFLYDGWNIVAELGGAPDAPELVQSYLWGPDLSGSGQGAGGVGGLLAIERHQGQQAGVHFVSHDGNGNVVGLTDAATGQRSASYEYNPFGNLLEKSGPFAELNPYRFSTKRQDSLTGLYDYGFRSYDPKAGRWLSRDPIAEDGGLNLYGFVGNDGVNGVDVLGLTGNLAAIGFQEAATVNQLRGLSQTLGAIGSRALPWVPRGTLVTAAGVGIFNIAEAEQALFDAGQERLKILACEQLSCHHAGQLFNVGLSGVSVILSQLADAHERGNQERAAKAMAGLTTAIDMLDLALEFLREYCPDEISRYEELRDKVDQASQKAKSIRLLSNASKGGAGKRFPEFRVGDPITKLTKNGAYPEWYVRDAANKVNSIQGRYWMNRAALAATGEFTERQLKVMRAGFAPKAKVRVKGPNGIEIRNVSKELHHNRRGRGRPGFDEPIELREVWPWEHELIDDFRFTGYEFLNFVD